MRFYKVYNFKEELWWSNENGWGDFLSADLFSEKERKNLNLPIGGDWICIVEAEAIHK